MCSSEDKKLLANKFKTSNDNGYPTIIFPCIDAELQKTRVMSIICAPSGVTTMHVDILKNEPSTDHFMVTLPWLEILVNPCECLKAICLNVTESNPQVVGFVNALRNYRSYIDEIPIALIKINLPISAQTDTESCDIKGGFLQTGKNVGVQLLCVNFQETPTECMVTKSTTTINFE